MSCNIFYQGKNLIVTEDNGDFSMLFETAKEFYGNQDKALNLWAATKTEDYQDVMGETPATLESALKYVDIMKSNNNLLSSEEMLQVRDFMEKTQVESLSDLSDTLNTIFKPDGIITLNEKAAIDSGLYTREDLETIDLSEVGEMLTKIDSTLKVTDIEIETDGTVYDTINSSQKTLFGTSERMSNEEVSNVLKEQLQPGMNDSEFMLALSETPFQNIIELAQNDPQYFRDLKNSIDTTQNVSKVEIGPDGNLRVATTNTFETTKAMLPMGTNTTKLKARLNIMRGFTDFAWTKENSIKKVLRENAKIFSDYNVDLVGIENLFANRGAADALVQSAIEMLDKPTDTTIENFSNLKDELLGTESSDLKLGLSDNYLGLNVVRMETIMSDEQAFSDHGLIKIGDNLYHKVNKEDSLEAMYEYLYDMYMTDEVVIPQGLISVKDKKNPLNKVGVLEDLSKFINNRETGLRLGENREKVSAMQVAFGHTEIPATPKTTKVKNLSKVLTDTADLLQTFVPSFYNYVILEKAKDSYIYRNVLSKLKFTQKGIVSVAPIKSLQGVESRGEFEDYIRLKRDSDLDNLVESPDGIVAEDLMTVNFPETIQEQQGDYFAKGEYLIIPNTRKTYAKSNGKLYRKVEESTNQSLYQELQLDENTTMLDPSLDFEYDEKKASEFFKDHRIAVPQNTPQRNAEILEKANFSNVQRPVALANGIRVGAQEVLNENPQLSEIGTVEQYTEYLNEISSEPIVYKGLRNKSNQVHITPNHTYFSANKEISEKWYKNEEGVKTFVIPNTATVDFRVLGYEGVNSLREQEQDFINSTEGQLIRLNTEDIGGRQIQYVLNRETPAIELGSQEDVEGFKNFVGREVSNMQQVEERPGVTLMTIGDSQVYFKERITPDGNNTGQIELDLITTSEEGRGKGSAKSALKEFLKYTDSIGKDVYLFAAPRDNSTTTEGLLDFYRSEGFRSESEFLEEEMVRKSGGYTKTTSEIIAKLKETGLASEVFQLNTTQLLDKLKELGVSDDIAMQVAMQIKNGYYSNAQTAFTNLKDKNVKNTQGWLKALTDIQKNGGVKNVNQELEWIGLEDFLNEYVKENNPKNGNIPASVVEEYILSNQIEIVDVSKGVFEQNIPLEGSTFDTLIKGENISQNGKFKVVKEFGEVDKVYYIREGESELINAINGVDGINDTIVDFIKRPKGRQRTADTKYSGYQLKGGENYREVLLTMPNKDTFNNNYSIKKDDNGDYYLEDKQGNVVRRTNIKNSQIAEDNFRKEFGKEGDKYRSSHWDEANILAHTRLNEKTLPDGRRVLIVNEIQSDWAQQGRKDGFKRTKQAQDELIAEHRKVLQELEELDAQIIDAVENKKSNILELGEKKVELIKKSDELRNDIFKPRAPQMPYKNTDQWVGLVTRRVMQMASQEGYDGIAFATGQQSADMYSLSNQVDKVSIMPNNDTRFVHILLKNNSDDTLSIDNNGVIVDSVSGAYNGKQAEEVLGKDLTRKILETEEETTLEGEGLEFGGEGMKTFYDKIVFKVLGQTPI